MKVGLIGLGVVGNALKVWIQNNNPKIKISCYDPQKNLNDKLTKCDVFFIQIPVLNEKDGYQNIDDLISTILKLPNKPIFIRSTILPSSYDELIFKFKDREIFYMPEFLSDRTAIEDFEKEPIICTGRDDILRKIFKDKIFIKMTSREAILAKYAHNCLGASLVVYFNSLAELCDIEKIEYENVIKGISSTNHFNMIYSHVPGYDQKFGYGGKCFPKDVDAFKYEYSDKSIGKFLKTVSSINNFFRKPLKLR